MDDKSVVDTVPASRYMLLLEKHVQVLENHLKLKDALERTEVGFAKAVRASVGKTSRWTPTELDTLIEMRNNGATAPAIAEKLGRTVEAVRCRIRMLLGIQLTRSELRKIRVGFEKGLDAGTIARQLNRSMTAVVTAYTEMKEEKEELESGDGSVS